jgi:hypothetical protein
MPVKFDQQVNPYLARRSVSKWRRSVAAACAVKLGEVEQSIARQVGNQFGADC